MNKKLMIPAILAAALALSACSWFAPPTEIDAPMTDTTGRVVATATRPPLAIPTATPVVVVVTAVPLPTPAPIEVEKLVTITLPAPPPIEVEKLVTVTIGLPLTPAIGASWVYTSLQYDSMPNWDCSKPGPFTTALMPGQKNYAAYYICVANAARTYDALVKSVQGLQVEAQNVGAVAYAAPAGKTMGRTFELQQAWLIWASTCTTLTGVPGDASMPSKEGGTKGCLIFLPPNGGAARTFDGFDWAVAVR